MCFPPLSSELWADLQLKGQFWIDYFPPAVCKQIYFTTTKLLLDSFYEQQMMYLWH